MMVRLKICQKCKYEPMSCTLVQSREEWESRVGGRGGGLHENIVRILEITCTGLCRLYVVKRNLYYDITYTRPRLLMVSIILCPIGKCFVFMVTNESMSTAALQGI